MSLDIKYRPRDYSDVLGQEATMAILREYVRSGRGFQQSYLFCGGHGSGKTTLGRILARALLCEAPKNGDPCNECHSCRSLLDHGVSADFIEVDAATNSGKADITKITDEVAYATFSGKRRIYLFDESHQLSRDALDALLKYLEDTFPGSQDKKLTCIFCTTEPEKMRATILSRCAPAFVVVAQKPEHIAQRLADICAKEGMEFEHEMLTLIAEITECHIRDAMKAIEGVSMLGAINKANVTAYLHLDLNTAYIGLLAAIGHDLPAALAAAKNIMLRVSPASCYGKLADVAMLAFQASLGDGASGPWNPEALKALGAKGEVLLGYASRFANRPGRPTSAMLLLDIAALHHVGGSVRSPMTVLQVQMAQPAVPAQAQAAPAMTSVPQPAPQAQAPVEVRPAPVLHLVQAAPTAPQEGAEKAPAGGNVPERDQEWEVDPRLVRRRVGVAAPVRSTKSPLLSPSEFSILLGKHLIEKGSSGGRPSR